MMGSHFTDQHHSYITIPMSFFWLWFFRWRKEQTSGAAAPLPFTPSLWRPVIWAITNIFETGRAAGDPAALQRQDNGIISYGSHQATLAAGTLAQVVERYIQTSHTPAAAALRPWLPRIQAKDPSLRYATDLHQLLKNAAADSAMNAAQDHIFDQLYYQPAITRAEERGLRTPLALACLYDTGVQGGRDHILTRLTASASQPETAWIARFLDEREKWLLEMAEHAAANDQPQQAQFLRNSRFRVHELRHLLRKGNLTLRGRIRLRGQTIDGLAG